MESEEARLEEKKEAEYKPVVMGKSAPDFIQALPDFASKDISPKRTEEYR